MSSYQDKLATASSKIRRKLFDHSVQMKGREVEVTRFFVEEDIYADEVQTKISQSSITAIIVYPPGEVPLQRFRGSATSPAVDDSGTFFFDILPIEVYTRWTDRIEMGDYLFQIVKDENGDKIGILLKVSNMFGSWDTEIIWRKAWAAPYNGDLPTGMQQMIDTLLA